MHAHTDDHITAYIEAAGEAFASIARVADAGAEDVRRLLRGAPATAGFKRLA
jgi:hypothetical protein